jgi:hypothetical protein
MNWYFWIKESKKISGKAKPRKKPNNKKCPNRCRRPTTKHNKMYPKITSLIRLINQLYFFRWDIRWIWGSWRTLSWWKSNWWSCPPILWSTRFHQLWSSSVPIPKIRTATPTPSCGQKWSNIFMLKNTSPPWLIYNS